MPVLLSLWLAPTIAVCSDGQAARIAAGSGPRPDAVARIEQEPTALARTRPAVTDDARDSQTAVLPYEATYKASLRLIPAWVEISLKTDAEGQLTLRSEVRGRGWAALKKGRIVEMSQVRLAGEDPRPIRYEMRNGFSRKDRDIVTRFEDDGSAISTYRGDELPVQSDRPLVDLLTLRLVLSEDLAHDRLSDEYVIVDGKGRLKVIDVVDTGTETLDTGMGRLETRRVEYASGDDRRYVIWFAPAFGFRMAKLEQYEDDRLRGRLVLHEFRSASFER